MSNLKARPKLARLRLGFRFNIRHQLEFLGVRQYDIHAKTRHLENQRLGHGNGFEVGCRICPGDNNPAFAQVPSLFLHNCHQIRQALERVIDVTLHVQHRNAGVLGNLINVLVANSPIAVADRQPIKIATVNLANFLRSIAMLDLGCAALNECSMPPQLGNPSFKGSASACAGEKE